MMVKINTAFDISKCARPNILSLHPYRCARDDYKDDGTNVLLDANENAYGPGLDLSTLNGSTDASQIDLLGLHRYPDPHQIPLKSLLCDLRKPSVPSNHPPLTPDNLFTGVGSDEAIDALLRCFCRPGVDSILTCPPTYGMYAVSADVNDVSIVKVPLLPENFALDVLNITATLNGPEGSKIKAVYICSPGNPTGALIDPKDIQSLLEIEAWNGLIIVDEAYVDFSGPNASVAPWVTTYPNLVVMQTLSKAFGLAGIRLGAAFTSPQIARLLNNMKAPYNISNPTSVLATKALEPQGLAVSRNHVAALLTQRKRLTEELPKIRGVGRLRGGLDSNFLLYELLDASGQPSNQVALAVYESLASKRGVVVRFRGKESNCTGCLRITVGTERENSQLLAEIRRVLESVLDGKHILGKGDEEQIKENQANEVIA